jgi:hypothetical protein
MAGAATALKNGATGLANAAKKTQAGGLAAKASQLSSGVSNLPGGIKAFSSVTDKAEGAFNKIPGTEQLTGAMTDLQTQVTNGIGKISAVAGAAGGALSAAGSAANAVGLGDVGSVASKAGGLTSSITSKLPIGQATQLLSSVSALGAGGASPIKLPSMGINTTDRTGITSQVKGLLGNPKIPEPNLLGDIKDETISSLDQKILGLRKELAEALKEVNTARDFKNAALDRAYILDKTLPEGDPEIEEATAAYVEAVKKETLAIQKYIAIAKQTEAATSAGLRNTPGGRLFGI